MVTCAGRALPLGQRTVIMGIVNVTPDSFSDGGMLLSADAAIGHALRLLEDGADILDVGGESTRPGAMPVMPADELARVLPVVEGLVARGVRNISVDTRNAETARLCLLAGASWVNDVSALTHDSQMVRVAQEAEAVVLMHAREMSAGADDRVSYVDVVEEVASWLAERVAVCVAHGVRASRCVVDPGIGFGKSLADNLALSRGLERLSSVGAAVLYGPSRKRFLGTLARVDEAAARDAATHGAIAFAALHGADIVRVHDVKGAAHVLRVVDSLRMG